MAEPTGKTPKTRKRTDYKRKYDALVTYIRTMADIKADVVKECTSAYPDLDWKTQQGESKAYSDLAKYAEGK